ncbi:MAG: efflux RND transporter periplasmic adaptor subunit, partial [Luteimonas sp.]
WNAPGARLPGTIREIAAAADAQTRSYATRVALDDAAARSVELGQSARVYVQDAAAGAAALSLPLAAIQRGGNGAASVWVVDSRTRALTATPVRIGALGAERVPVLSGVSADAWVVSAGGHLLRDGQSVTAVDADNRPVFDALRSAAAR